MLKIIDHIKKIFTGDGDGQTNLNQFMRKKQNIVGICVLALLIIMTLVLHFLSESKTKTSAAVPQKKATTVDGVLSTDFTQKNELSALEQQQAQMDVLKKQLLALDKKAQAHEAGKAEQKAALLKEINVILSNRVTQREAKTRVPQKSGFATTPHAASPLSNHNADFSGAAQTVSATHQPLETIDFHYNTPARVKVGGNFLEPHYSQHRKTPKTYVPAGTFAKAVLLEGADANASVNGQSDTAPILVRILNNGTLPNGHHSHLHGCFVLASLYGDISSERGEARLTRLSCTRPDGSILEKKVQGYLSFAGKEGIKGHPVMRNGKILMMAGISGMLSGVGSALQQSSQTQSISPLGATTTVSPSQVWKNGAYGGASTAMSQLASYYIKRADQYHPIIEIGSGTVATIIFQRGFSLVNNDDDTQAGHPIPAPKTTNYTDEIKTLLKHQQKLIQAEHTSPFSNVN